MSRLSILSAERQHSGIYSCSIINSTSATVDVQILNGKQLCVRVCFARFASVILSGRFSIDRPTVMAAMH